MTWRYYLPILPQNSTVIMNTQTRRQREFQQREQLFLETARQIIKSDGFHALTMEKIAAETEYAKGTIYKHFSNKEDLIVALCGQGLSYLVSLCEEMTSFPGKPREQLAVMAIAYQLYAGRYPEEYDLIMEARAGNLREKASAERLEQTDEQDARLLQLIRTQIETAISDGDLSIPVGLQPDDICFGLWSMAFGVTVLQQARDLLTNLQISDDEFQLSRQLTCLLDGYQWRPLSHEQDYLSILAKAGAHLKAKIESR